MPVRVLPDDLINQIAAGEVVERPASVVKELVENALDAGADQIVIDITDGGRTLINVVDNGSGMSRDDLSKCIMRHATSKLAGNDLLDINTMGFRGEALPSIASVSNMTIDTVGLRLDCETFEIKPSSWEIGTRVRVENLFSKTPARLKFLRSDRAEMMSVAEIVKRMALARPDAGFVLNNKWRFPKGQSMHERIVSVMGDDVCGRMIELPDSGDGGLKLTGFISEPTLRRASSIDQYLFVNNRPVKDKVMVGALRAAYMDVMAAREFPVVALYLELSPREVDVNVSPAKTEVNFLEPSRVRAFIIRTLRNALEIPLINKNTSASGKDSLQTIPAGSFSFTHTSFKDWNNHRVREPVRNYDFANGMSVGNEPPPVESFVNPHNQPLGHAIGQIGNKYVIAESADGLVVVDQHAAHERIIYERLRNREIKRQLLLSPLVVKLKPEEIAAVMEVANDLSDCGLKIEEFGEDAVAIYEKPADWDLDWNSVLRDMAAEIRSTGHSSKMSEKLHLKLAGYACHHSVRAGQKLDLAQQNTLLRDIESTMRGGQCNHGRPVYKIIPVSELDNWFER
ncbi:MAG: DNA mismatch repair endonuclease MutL [Alphaproteobacteria bacterium]|nr:DNA mismatch repair endonuclease MutL [Alphaproteobacteria bacterium]